MPDPNQGMPISLIVAMIALSVAGLWAWENRRRAWGIPTLAVLATVGTWYVGDYFYNDYQVYRTTIGDEYLNAAWWQVCWFVGAFSALVPLCHRLLNERLQSRGSFVTEVQKTRILEQPRMQSRLDNFGIGLVTVWLILTLIGLSRVKWDVEGLLLPWLSGYKVNPWGRGRLGGGFDALLSFAGYLQIFLTAGSGVLLALSRNPRTRLFAGLVFALSIPWFFLDRTRNTMIATLLPGLLAWVFLRFRGTIWMKVCILGGAFLFLNSWFTVVMESRGEGQAVTKRFSERGLQVDEETKHEGLNMFEELAWMNKLVTTKKYEPDWGQRYFAEAVNPIPRALWAGKPTIGLDYSVARGQRAVGGAEAVTATISTGMIGQGCANFGFFWGPLAAALLMAIWVALLARDDLLSHNEPGRLMLYASGLILTFNLGRDITLLVLYPYLFGCALFWFLDKQRGGSNRSVEYAA